METTGEGHGRFSRSTALFLIVATTASLAPFANKAFHIDDPVYLRIAQHIHNAPLDPFGFTMNWYGTDMPVTDFNQNPPGVSYYLALGGAIFGWGEVALHVWMLLPAIAVILGTYTLACRMTTRPLVAALATLFAPAFLVSSTNLMADVLLLACYVWAVALWVMGMESRKHWLLAASGLLMAAAFFTKYFGISLVPLLFAYSLVREKRVGPWLAYFLIPLAAVAAYQWYSAEVYGKALLTAATSYASDHAAAGSSQSFIAMTFTTLSFTGGCFFSVACFTPRLWRRATLVWGAALVAVCMLVPVYADSFISPELENYQRLSPMSVALAGVFIAGGLQLLALAFADVRRRDATSTLLILWLFGTLVFAAFVNWTISTRSLLPLAPVVGILLARRLDAHLPQGRSLDGKTFASLALAAGIAMWVAVGDYQFAGNSRSAAHEFAAMDIEEPVYFQGHWGFQFYMEEAGFPPMDFIHTQLRPGDVVIIPTDNTNIRYYDPAQVMAIGTVTREVSARVATVSIPVGAGFYSHGYGPLPFVLGPVPQQEFQVYRVGPPALPQSMEGSKEDGDVTR